MRKGVDVSAYQGTIDYDALKAEMSFVIAKLSEGVGFKDSSFDRNWSEAKRVGMTRGAYHFARPDLGNSPQEEAAYFLSLLGPVSALDLLSLDYEVFWSGDVVGWCFQWLEQVKQVTGTAAYLYTTRSLAGTHDWTSVVTGGYPLWLAAPDGQPDTVPQTQWPTVSIKQWTSQWIQGVPLRPVDLDTWFEEAEMNQDQFNRWFDARLAESPEFVQFESATKGALVTLAGGEDKLRQLIHDTEYEAVVTALLDIKPEALKPTP